MANTKCSNRRCNAYAETNTVANTETNDKAYDKANCSAYPKTDAGAYTGTSRRADLHLQQEHEEVPLFVVLLSAAGKEQKVY